MKYKLLKADLLGNDEDGYDWNDSYECGTYDLPDDINSELSDDVLLDRLIEHEVFAKGLITHSDYIDIDMQWSDSSEAPTYYFDFNLPECAPRSRVSFELRPA